MQEKLFEERLSLRAGVAILFVLYVGRAGVNHATWGMGADAWLGMLLGFAFSLPMLLILARLVQLLPEMNLFEMLRYGFGRGLAYVLSALYFLYFLALAATVLEQVQFVRFAGLPQTPLAVIVLFFFAAGIYLARVNVHAMGKWSVLAGLIIIGIALLLTLFALPHLRTLHLLPIGRSGDGVLLQGGYRFMVSPLGEAVVLLTLLGKRAKPRHPYRMFLFGAGFASLFFVLTFLRDRAILGASVMERVQFAPYHAASGIQIGALGSRVESLLTILVLLSGFTMLAVYLFAASRILPRSEGRGKLLFVAILAMVGVLLLHAGVLAGVSLGALHLRYAPVMQSVIPALLWLVAEVKARRA